MANESKKKVVILGGGLGAVSAAWELTNDPDWRAQFESITLYQLGWRLGGKGASGRGVDGRIEEHGLHVMLGFYENTFRILREAYAELNRPPDAPLATWQQAFQPHDYVVLMNRDPDAWRPWPVPFPPNGRLPGEAAELPGPDELMERGLQLLWPLLEELHAGLPHQWLTEAAMPDARGRAASRSPAVLDELDRWLRWLWQVLQSIGLGDWNLRRLMISLNLGMSFLRGYFADVVMQPGRDIHRLDDLDFRDWLKGHGAWKETLQSGYVTGLYNLAFSTRTGAGSAIVGFSRMLLDYAGSIFWKMQAGMGDAIFAPLYEVLSRRGVRFEFFHRVDRVGVSADGTHVDRIEIGRQATLAEGVDRYEPLVSIKGLPCWPSTPRYELLAQGAELKASGENLENWWTRWKDPAPPLVLRRGQDFDEVVLGLSVASFPYVAQEVIRASPAFADMVASLETTQTESAQLWFSKDIRELGWTRPSPVLDGYAEPFDTWADMSQLIPHGGLLAPHEVTLTHADSHPIARDLGFASQTYRAPLCMWMQIDFDLLAGRVVAGGT